MARWRSYMETTTEDYLSVDLAKLKSLGMLDRYLLQTLTWSRSGNYLASIQITPASNSIAFGYTHGAKGSPNRIAINETIHLSETPCNFGGIRKWFICPSCHNRARVLYGGKYFRCRKCYGLNYPSQYEEKRFRYLGYARDIQRKVGGDWRDLDAPLAKRPKGMHRKTYQRLKREYDYYRNYGFLMIHKKWSKYVG